MNYKYIVFYIALLIYLPAGCISTFENPEGTGDMAGILVVEGVIAEESTKINLSRTVALSDDNPLRYENPQGVSNASVRIIDEENNIIAVAERVAGGSYIVNERFSFVPDMKYALDIRLGDNHYQSAFVAPASTPAIDEVTWELNDDNSIDIFVSTHDPNNETLYCLWDFMENWELKARYRTLDRYDPTAGKVIPQSLTGDNRYYCWATGYSNSLLLASTEKLRESVIRDYRIHTLQPGNSRYSLLYSITVNQYSLSKESSAYFNNLLKNIEESGSLFAPQPSEISGNIRCLSDPNETVIGYVFAAKPATSRLFIPMAELNLSHLENPPSCPESQQFDNPASAYNRGYGIYGTDNLGRYLYVPRRCVDCTQSGLGNPNKTKPDYWPNDHQ